MAIPRDNLTFGEYQKRAMSTALYPGDQLIVYPALGVSGEAGEIANQVKKMLRDDDGFMTPERADKVADEIGDVLWYCAALAADCGFSLERLAQANLDKLQQRKETGTIKGDRREH